MKKIHIALVAAILLGALFIQLLGLMELIPLYISSPILFVTLFVIVVLINSRNRFKGF
ncbi:hypothetical protein [Peribacillus saganii]|uniref:hypothetical protein n=1 Tax=Peribacillus saganii TaxID=2303992 RepID=UPI0018F204B5|nr:hypothetical protein [Peribacillus saganii]